MSKKVTNISNYVPNNFHEDRFSFSANYFGAKYTQFSVPRIAFQSTQQKHLWE